jgi:hypothetical protein
MGGNLSEALLAAGNIGHLCEGCSAPNFKDVNDRSPEQVRADIEVAREATLRSLDAVRQELSDALDWRTHYRRHRWQWLAVACGVGFIIGTQTRK